MRTTTSIVSLVLAMSCATPPGPPAEVGRDIVAALDAGDAAAADAKFRAVSGKKDYRERIYPVLYDTARGRYAGGDAPAAVPLLRFLVRHYQRSTAAPEALLYALFVQRSGQPEPTTETTAAIDAALATLRERRQDLPAWVSLVETQQSIDRGEIDDARAAFARFQGAWNGEPAALAVYADDLQRYLHAR